MAFKPDQLVTAVRVLARHVVELTFDDGAVRILDLERWLTGPRPRLLAEAYDAFCAVRVNLVSGTICWPGGAEFSAAGRYLAAHPA